MSERIEQTIISYEDWDQADGMDMQFYDCTFKRDFGPWKQGETVGCVVFEWSKSRIAEFDTDGVATRTCPIEMKPMKVAVDEQKSP